MKINLEFSLPIGFGHNIINNFYYANNILCITDSSYQSSSYFIQD